MHAPCPHYLLFSDSHRTADRGQWRFLIQSVEGGEQLEVSEEEGDVRGERLELLAVVRGLEALPAPARVTLITPSKYVNRGLAYGLDEWRLNEWHWERFGEMVPVKNRDLWQRVDRALRFHRVECRIWRFDQGAAAVPSQPKAAEQVAAPLPTIRRSRARSWSRPFQRLRLAAARRWAAWGELVWLRAAQLGTCLLPPPWLN
jgi:ribonuclease HI